MEGYTMSRINNDDRDQTLDSLFSKERKPEEPEETRSKRGNILFTPSLYEDMRILAKAEGTSFNDLLNRISQEYADQHRQFIEAEKAHQAHIAKLIDEANQSRKKK